MGWRCNRFGLGGLYDRASALSVGLNIDVYLGSGINLERKTLGCPVRHRYSRGVFKMQTENQPAQGET